jgi:hypothetical protein
MATNIKDYSTTQASNTSLNSIFVGEGMLPSNLNNAIRALMKNTRDWFNDAEWIEYGDGSGAYTSAYVSGTSFTIAGADVTSVYHAGRRVKVIAPTPGTIYGTISSSSFSTDTTVNVTWDSGSLSNEAITNIFIGILSKTNNSIPTELITDAQVATGANINAAKLGTGVVDNTEFNYLNGVTSNIQTQLDAKQATITGGASTITSSNLTVSRALESNGSGKVAVSSVTSTELGYLSGVTSAIQTQFSNKQPLDAQLTDIAGLTPTDSNFIVGDGTNFVAESGATVRTSLGLGSIATQDSNNVTITGGSITGMSTPSLGSDVTTKTYVDDLVAGLKTRIITRLATTANLDLATDLENGDTLDGVSLVTGNKILVKDQTNQTQNGIYIVPASGAASRDPDFDTVAELAGQLVIVQEGSTNADKIYLCTTDNSGSIGSVNITFSQVQPSFTGTVTSVAVADAGSSEFTVSGSPITSSGTITLAVNSIDASKIGNGDVSNTELSYVNGVTSAIQTQINGKLANVVEDTTPQLGGNLDVNTNSIVSVSNGNIAITPNGTGSVVIDGLSHPQADGSAGQFLKTDGSGNLSFDTVSTAATVLTTQGDILYRDGSGLQRLGAGTAGQALQTILLQLLVDMIYASSGGILQTVSATDSSSRTTLSTTYTTASNTLSLTLTPAATSSKVLVTFAFNGGNSDYDYRSFYTIFRDISGGTKTNLAPNGNDMATHEVRGSGDMRENFMTLSYLDSPNTTSSVTYTVEVKAEINSTAYLGSEGTGNSYALEIGA